MLSDERLAAIREFVKYRGHIIEAELLAEVDRLREGDRLLADAWDEGYQACLRQWNRPANADRMPERNPHIRAALDADEAKS